MAQNYFLCRFSGSILVVLLLVSCGRYDSSGKPTLEQLKVEAKPFIERFHGSILYSDRVEQRMLFLEPSSRYIDPAEVDELANKEGWIYVGKESDNSSYIIKYAKRRLCLNLERTDGKSILTFSWSRNTVSWNYCNDKPKNS